MPIFFDMIVDNHKQTAFFDRIIDLVCRLVWTLFVLIPMIFATTAKFYFLKIHFGVFCHIKVYISLCSVPIVHRWLGQFIPFFFKSSAANTGNFYEHQYRESLIIQRIIHNSSF